MKTRRIFPVNALIFLLLFTHIVSGQIEGARDCRAVRGGDAIPGMPSGPVAPDEVRFAAAGDTGTGCEPDNEDRRLVCEIVASMLKTYDTARFGMLILLGDNVYESGSIDDFREKLYAPFDRLSQRGVIVKGVVGNHDVRSYDGANLQMKFFQAADAASQRKYFTTPAEQHETFPESSARYYSFRSIKSDVEFFALESSMLVNDCCGPSFWKRKYKKEERIAQADWLVRTLAESKARWKIVLLHHPFYSSALEHGVRIKDGREEIPERMALLRTIPVEGGLGKGKTIETIIQEAGVDLVLAGHDHIYERIVPQKGIRYLVSGAGSKLRRDNFDARLPGFHLCGESQKGSFMLFSIRPDAISFWSIDQDGVPFDHGIITK